MGTESYRPSADELWERRKAGRLLRKLDVYESFAASSEGPQDSLRIACADRYRELIGVRPESRGLLRDRLSDLKTGETVADILEAIRSEVHQNGSTASWESFS